MPPGGAGNPAASSAAWRAARSWSRITRVAAPGALRRSPCPRMVVGHRARHRGDSPGDSPDSAESRAIRSSGVPTVEGRITRHRRARSEGPQCGLSSSEPGGGAVIDRQPIARRIGPAGSGLGTIYRALDELVELYTLEDAAVVVEVPGFGRQVLQRGSSAAAATTSRAARRASRASTSSRRSTIPCSTT